MKKLSLLLVAGLLTLTSCGEDDGGSGVSKDPPAKSATTAENGDAAVKKESSPTSAKGTKIVLDDSEFGSMLFNSKKQAIYIFENDGRGKPVCYGECAEAWPPVFANGKPQAAEGVDRTLLGTVKRRDGKAQVTYADKPLYYYAHEGPGEVRCHNVNLNGGLWWVVGPGGNRRP